MRDTERTVDLAESGLGMVDADFLKNPHSVEVKRYSDNAGVRFYPNRDVPMNFTLYAEDGVFVGDVPVGFEEDDDPVIAVPLEEWTEIEVGAVDEIVAHRSMGLETLEIRFEEP